MINHAFISFSAVQIYELSYIHLYYCQCPVVRLCSKCQRSKERGGALSQYVKPVHLVTYLEVAAITLSIFRAFLATPWCDADVLKLETWPMAQWWWSIVRPKTCMQIESYVDAMCWPLPWSASQRRFDGEIPCLFSGFAHVNVCNHCPSVAMLKLPVSLICNTKWLTTTCGLRLALTG